MSQTTQQATPAGTWSADKIHSTVGFAVALMAGTFQGTFSSFDARSCVRRSWRRTLSV